jgi:glycosyltransferase involved in cell wall biosynthesis
MENDNKLNVTLINRARLPGRHSIEGLFDEIQKALADRVRFTSFHCSPTSSRARCIFEARKHSGTVNHVTGDAHYLAIALRGKNNLITVHDLRFFDYSKSVLKKIVFSLLWFRLPLARTKLITVVSEFTKQAIIKRYSFPADKIVVIPNPVKRIFRYSPAGPRNGTMVIMFIGTSKHKNLTNLIRAAEGKDWHLDIIGRPDSEDSQLLQTCKVSHSLSSNLDDSQVYEHYKNADILFFASFYEGFGMPIIEAQSVGRPVVTSKIGAMKEVAKDSAVLVDPASPTEIRQAIESLEDPERYSLFVAKGLENSSHFNIENIANKYLAIYKYLSTGSGDYFHNPP